MPAEDPTAPPANLRSWATVVRRSSIDARCQSVQLSRRIDSPTPEGMLTAAVGFVVLGWLEPPQPPNSATQQMSAAAGGSVRWGWPFRV